MQEKCKCQELGPNVKLTHSHYSLSVANKIVGDTDLQFTVDGHRFIANVLVSPTIDEFLLGSDWLVQNEAKWVATGTPSCKPQKHVSAAGLSALRQVHSLSKPVGLSDHATFHHDCWFSTRGDRLIPILEVNHVAERRHHRIHPADVRWTITVGPKEGHSPYCRGSCRCPQP